MLHDHIGFGRNEAQTFYSQVVARQQTSNYFLNSQANAATLLSFLVQAGAGAPIWCSNWVAATDLAADVGAADTVLNVTDTAGISVKDWLCFGVGLYGQVIAINAGANTITLAAALGTAVQASATVVSHLVLSRFSRPAVMLEWISPDYASAQVPMTELPNEYTAPANETIGTTIGLLAPRCYLYAFSQVIGGVAYGEYVTSHEFDQNDGTNMFSSALINHGEITQGLRLDQDEVEITVDITAVAVLLQMATMQCMSPLYVQIISATTDGHNATAETIVFSGEITKASVKGNRIKAAAVSAGSTFDRQTPRFLFQLDCNHGLFNAGCTLVAANWKFSAAIAALAAGGYPFAYEISGLAGVGMSANAVAAAAASYFAGGWIEFNAGAELERRAILDNTAFAGVSVTSMLTLDRDPVVIPIIGTGVTLYPGCDLTYPTCQGKFNNYANFGGHPFMPFANPTYIAQQGQMGKK